MDPQSEIRVFGSDGSHSSVRYIPFSQLSNGGGGEQSAVALVICVYTLPYTPSTVGYIIIILFTVFIKHAFQKFIYVIFWAFLLHSKIMIIHIIFSL